LPNGTVTVNSQQKIGNVVAPCTIEQEWTKSLNQAVGECQAGGIPNNIVHATSEPFQQSRKLYKECQRKSKIVSNSSNELPHLRHSKCLVNGLHDLVDIDATDY
jgi:hypothetical protein